MVLKDQIQHLVGLHLPVAGTAGAMVNLGAVGARVVGVDEIMVLTATVLVDKAIEAKV
jgi:hypothetical protein